MEIKFSPANTKLKKLYKIESLQSYLSGNRKIYSFDLLAGHTCPLAKLCYSKAIETEEVRDSGIPITKIKDGPQTKFRCFAASNENQYPETYAAHKLNTEAISNKTTKEIVELLLNNLPQNAGIIRIHSSGDFKNKRYFKAWLIVAKLRPDILFYFYTKMTPYLVEFKDEIPNNMVYTASYGGKRDDLIKKYGLRHVKVINYEKEALGGLIDNNDNCAANPKLRNKNFHLIVHSTQPPNTEAARAVYKQRKSKA